MGDFKIGTLNLLTFTVSFSSVEEWLKITLLVVSIIYPTKFKATIYLHWQKVIYNPKPIVVKYQGFAMVSFVLIIYLLKVC